MFKLSTLLCGAALCCLAPQVKADFAAESGPYRVIFSGKNKFCISKILYQGYEIGGDRGYYGTILATAPNQFIGAGHSEGGAEKVLSTDLQVDGANFPRRSGLISGKKIVFKKVSMLDKLKLDITFTLTPEEFRIDKSWVATAPQKIHSFYIYQFCWSANTDQWAMHRPQGAEFGGKFQSNNSWVRESGEVNMFALYSAAAKKGIAGYFANYFRGQGVYWLWDKKIYHKFYFPANNPDQVAKGYKSPIYTLILKGFEADNASWRQQVQKLALGFQEKYPLQSVPKVIQVNFGHPDGLALAGNGSFKCHKVTLDLLPNCEYEVEVQLLKPATLSKSPSDNCILIGHFLPGRKFKSMFNCGGHIAKDEKWHKITKRFRTPAKLFEPALFIYNCKTTDVFKIKELKITRLSK